MQVSVDTRWVLPAFAICFSTSVEVSTKPVSASSTDRAEHDAEHPAVLVDQRTARITLADSASDGVDLNG